MEHDKLDQVDEILELKIEFLQDILNSVETYLPELPELSLVKEWGHRLTGSGGMFGLPEISELGRRLEKEIETLSPDEVRGLVLRVKQIAQEALTGGKS